MSRQVRHGVGTVDFLQPAGLDVLQHPGPKPFGVADDDGVEMRGRLLGAERGMKTAGDDNLAPAAEFGGDLVRPGRQGRHKRHADHVAGHVEIERLDVFVAEGHFVFRRA